MRLVLDPRRAAPAEDPPHELLGLTHGIWEYCLLGIGQFRLAYPGLYFKFQIYVDLHEEEVYLGYGALLGAPTLQAPAPTANELAVTKRSPLNLIVPKNALPDDSVAMTNLTVPGDEKE